MQELVSFWQFSYKHFTSHCICSSTIFFKRVYTNWPMGGFRRVLVPGSIKHPPVLIQMDIIQIFVWSSLHAGIMGSKSIRYLLDAWLQPNIGIPHQKQQKTGKDEVEAKTSPTWTNCSPHGTLSVQAFFFPFLLSTLYGLQNYICCQVVMKGKQQCLYFQRQDGELSTK